MAHLGRVRPLALAIALFAYTANEPACRRAACVLTMVTGSIGGVLLGWIAWGFWTN